VAGKKKDKKGTTAKLAERLHLSGMSKAASATIANAVAKVGLGKSKGNGKGKNKGKKGGKGKK
jgi:hypothetical protein